MALEGYLVVVSAPKRLASRRAHGRAGIVQAPFSCYVALRSLQHFRTNASWLGKGRCSRRRLSALFRVLVCVRTLLGITFSPRLRLGRGDVSSRNSNRE